MCNVKQGFRFLLRPQLFFNQLQWSSNHWLIILSFLVLATVETQVSRHHALYPAFAHLLEVKWGIGASLALWLVMAAKLALLLLGSYLIVLAIYFVGGLVGRASSRRVFLRRLAVVFTVVLCGFTVQHFGDTTPWLWPAAIALYAWGALLGFFAMREQFELNVIEAAFLSIFSFFLVGTTWQVTQKLFENAVESEMKALTQRQEPSQAPSYRKGARF